MTSETEGCEGGGVDRRVLMTGAGLAAAAVLAAGAQAQAQTRPRQGERDLQGKVALVTGARNNLGRGFAVALAEMGADVFVHHHTPDTRDQAEETARLCRAHGVRTEIYAAHLDGSASVRAMYDACFAAFGRLDVVVNNAGRIRKLPMSEISDDEFEACLAINTRAVFYSMREAARRIADNGRIINIGTSLLNASSPQYSAYAGTKAPMEEFSRMLSREIGSRRVTVNVVAPGAVNTPFFHGQETPSSVRYIQTATPAQRLGEVADIVPTVAFLASSRAHWITGQTIWVNDGYSTR
jgi:NAD(P)-dependent dehydrogenase (short-subunit alcohol dehydrogenase family)